MLKAGARLPCCRLNSAAITSKTISLESATFGSFSRGTLASDAADAPASLPTSALASLAPAGALAGAACAVGRDCANAFDEGRNAMMALAQVTPSAVAPAHAPRARAPRRRKTTGATVSAVLVAAGMDWNRVFGIGIHDRFRAIVARPIQ
ncbi:hypothetical protein PanNE5_08500 [Pandoraea sp. NE5]|nr:hypothetical protein PanNE5_08500 [Pandoraea sp. NE5]